MAYVIAEPCIGVKDTACVDACPVDCIHPRKDEAGFEEAAQLYIDPGSALIAERVCPFAPFLRSSLWTIFRVIFAVPAYDVFEQGAEPRQLLAAKGMMLFHNVLHQAAERLVIPRLGRLA